VVVIENSLRMSDARVLYLWLVALTINDEVGGFCNQSCTQPEKLTSTIGDRTANRRARQFGAKLYLLLFLRLAEKLAAKFLLAQSLH
jgi:hypothetical protein